MSKDLNSVVLVGRLVKDPEVRYTPSGTPVARISIANGERIKQNTTAQHCKRSTDNTRNHLSGSDLQSYLRRRQDLWAVCNVKNPSQDFEIYCNFPSYSK